MVQKKQNKLNVHSKCTPSRIFLKKNTIPEKNGSIKFMSQSRFPSAQITYSLLATKQIHQTNTNRSHKFLRFQYIMIEAPTHNRHCLKIKEFFLWNNSQSAATHLGWKGCCPWVILEHIEDAPTTFPRHLAFKSKILHRWDWFTMKKFSTDCR